MTIKIRPMKSMKELEVGLKMYADINDSTTIPYDWKYGVEQFKKLYGAPKVFMGIVDHDGEHCGFVIGMPIKYEYNPKDILLLRYYYSNLKGIQSAIALIKAHEALILFAEKNRFGYVLSTRNHRIDPDNKFGQILEKRGWEDRGAHMLYTI
jgi:hypothetical protein